MAEAAEALLGKEMDKEIEKLNKTLEYVKQEQRNRRIQNEISAHLPEYVEKIEQRRKEDGAKRDQASREEAQKAQSRQAYLDSLKHRAQEYSHLKTDANLEKTLKVANEKRAA